MTPASASSADMAAADIRQAVPLLGIVSMEASLRFYVDGLGFTMTNKWIDEGVLRWCWLQHGGAAIMLQEYRPEWVPGTGAKSPHGKGATVGLGVSLNFMCRDAIAFYKAVVARGIAAKRPFVGNRMWVTGITDPDGYELFFESETDAPEESEWTEPPSGP